MSRIIRFKRAFDVPTGLNICADIDINKGVGGNSLSSFTFRKLNKFAIEIDAVSTSPCNADACILGTINKVIGAGQAY